MSEPTLSPQEAQILVNHVQTAPLQNMEHAAQISVILQKFKGWYEHAMTELQSVESRIAAAVKEAEDKVHALYADEKATDEQKSDGAAS